jgi:hypothetical protein
MYVVMNENLLFNHKLLNGNSFQIWNFIYKIILNRNNLYDDYNT